MLRCFQGQRCHGSRAADGCAQLKAAALQEPLLHRPLWPGEGSSLASCTVPSLQRRRSVPVHWGCPTTLADLGVYQTTARAILDMSFAMPVMTCAVVALQDLYALTFSPCTCSSRRAWRRTWWSTGATQSTTLSGEPWHSDQARDLPSDLASYILHLMSKQVQASSSALPCQGVQALHFC